ncbi:MAG: MFS transporter [Alphaproteobacteria bacterium]|nr:MFS transporter [Alphaproteobacteria bacterium]
MNSDSSPSPSLGFVLFAVTLVQAVSTFSSLTLAATAPAIAADIGVPVEFIGLQIALVYTGASLISAMSGFLLRRWGPGRVSQISLVLCGLGAAMMAIPSVAMIAFGSLFMGFGYGMTNPSGAELLMRITPKRRRNIVYSIKQTGIPLGGMLAGAIAPAMTETISWQAAPLIGALSCFILAGALQPWRKGWDSRRDPNARLDSTAFVAMTMIWRIPTLRWMGVAGFNYAFIQLAISTFAVTILVVEAQFSLIAAGAVLAAVQAAGITGRLVWGWVADRWGIGDQLLLMMGVLNVMGGIGMMWIGPDWSIWAIYVFFVAFAASAYGWTGIFMTSTVNRAPPAYSGTAVGGIGVPVYAGVIFGTAALSLLADAMGSVSNAFAIVAMLAAIGTLALAHARRISNCVSTDV